MPTLFLALQCFHCSTMQVKQQRKSGGKWVCAVCNQRQSVRRVHAQGPLARDLRNFVQAFNMARSAADHGSDGRDWISPRSEGTRGGSEEECALGARRRTDWSEYLDPEEEEREGDGDVGADVTTEMPQEMLGMPSPKRSPRVLATEVSGPLKPNFSKKRRQCLHDVKGSSHEGSKCYKSTEMKASSSRWSEYLDEGKKDGSFKGEGEGISKLDAYGPWSVEERLFDDLPVEEEVHPDFK